MNKPRTATCVLLLLLSTILITTIPAAKAYDYDWFFASNEYTTNWLQYNDEAEHTWTAFTQIANLFVQKRIYVYYYGYWFDGGPSYGELNNWGSSRTPWDVYAQIDHDITHHPLFSTVLYVGHGGPDGFYVHTDYPNDPYHTPDLTSFNVIHSHTQSSPAHQFVLMWVCMGGENSPQGSPSAWNPLWWSNPPAYPPYTWVGFDGMSPWLLDQMTPGNIFRYWLVFFYYFALTGSYSVMDALNLASWATGASDFASSVLGAYGRYWSYWPYPPLGPTTQTGRMHVAGDPFGTYLPRDVYYYYG